MASRLIPLLAFALPLLAVPAAAQVTIDLKALEQLQGDRTKPPATKPQRPAAPQKRAQPARRQTATPAKPAAPAEAAKPVSPGAETSAAAVHPAQPVPEPATRQPSVPAGITPPSPPAPAAPAPQPPAVAVIPAVPPPATLPTAPPPAIRLTPTAPEPPAAAPPPPPAAPAVAADAGTTTAPIQDGLRVSFGPDKSQLSPASERALRDLIGRMPSNEQVTYDVRAYAAGNPQDPSTARRLSLSRSLAVRSILMAEGVPSARIYVRALGAVPGDGPADRVDVTVSGANAAAPAAQGAPR